MLLNPIANMIPWLPEAIKTVVTTAIYAMYDFFNAAGKFIVDAYNKYAIFTLHVTVIAIYGKYLFNKDIKIKYQEAIETINNDGQDDCKLSDAKCDYENITECLYILSAWVLSLITLNIIFPNFYHFTSNSLTKCLNLRGFSAGIQPDQKISHSSASLTLLTQPAHSYAIIPHHEVLTSATKTGNGAVATATSIYQSDTMTWTSKRSKSLVYPTVQTVVAVSSTQTCKHQKDNHDKQRIHRRCR